MKRGSRSARVGVGRPSHRGVALNAMTVPIAKLSFWGVRGSTPTVDPATSRYGGNTPCLELIAPDGTQIILDCGTGLRMLGSRWAAPNGGKTPETHILVTHYHWDHIQGIPFFSPLYVESNEFHFYSFRSKFLGRDSLKQVFEAQMALPYFPVDMSAMSAKRKFKEVDGGDSFNVGENKITARWLNHPQGCLGFRIETPAGIVAYATDNEPGDAKLDESLRELAAGADIFINDAQFTPEQLETSRKGWGHSSWLEGAKVARQMGAKTLVRDISLQGALISLKHLPRLQSELQVTMEAPGTDGLQAMNLRGYVVRIDAGTEKGHVAVGVVFTD